MTDQFNQLAVHPDSQEVQRDTEMTLGWLAFAGHDERKLLAILALDQAKDPIGATAIFETIDELSGQHDIGPKKRTAALLRHLITASLVKYDAVQTSIIDSITGLGGTVQATGFELNPIHRDFAVAFAGSLLKWSNDQPRLPLKLFGQTASTGNAPSPLSRFWVLADLTTTPETKKGPAMSYLADKAKITNKAIDATVADLEHRGLVTKQSTRKKYDRQFTILQPHYIIGERKRPFEHLSDTTKLLYKGLEHAHSLKDVWAVDEFFEETATQLAPSHEELAALRLQLHHVFKPGSKSLRGVIQAEARTYDALSKVSLSDDHAAAIADLVSIIDGFCVDFPAAITRGLADADAIMASPKSIASLYVKGSNNKKRYESASEPSFEQQISQVVIALGGSATANAIVESYIEQTGKHLSRGLVKNRLRALMAAESFEVVLLQTSPGRAPELAYQIK